MQRRLFVMSEAKCLQISHNKYASQRDAISPSMGDLMLSLSFSCKIDTRRCLSRVLTLCQNCIIYLCFRGLICCHFIKFFTCRIAIGGVVAGGMWRSLLRGARQPFPQVFANSQPNLVEILSLSLVLRQGKLLSLK